VLHAIGNNLQSLTIEPGSFLDSFYAATAAMSPKQRGDFLEHPPLGTPSITELHAVGIKGYF
jgi:hypothetical protein